MVSFMTKVDLIGVGKSSRKETWDMLRLVIAYNIK
jgi:hypothetical protein